MSILPTSLFDRRGAQIVPATLRFGLSAEESVAVLSGVLVLWRVVTFVLVPPEKRALQARFRQAYLQHKNRISRWLGKTRRQEVG
jgi:protein-S-isoprenylcysteine O-methyltransferase Ste14